MSEPKENLGDVPDFTVRDPLPGEELNPIDEPFDYTVDEILAIAADPTYDDSKSFNTDPGSEVSDADELDENSTDDE